MLSSAIMKRLQGEQHEHSSGEEASAEDNGHRQSMHIPRFPGSSLPEPIRSVSHAESAMRHSFQSQGYASPLPKLSLPNELNMLDHLFQNPMCPHPKASESTAYRHGGYSQQISNSVRSPGYYAQNGNEAGNESHMGENGDGHSINVPAVPTLESQGGNKAPIAATTPQDPATNMYYANGGSSVMPYGEPELAANGFDFLSFLAADDGGQGANAVWEQTESYRQDMPMLG
jgi:hypothetical protein